MFDKESLGIIYDFLCEEVDKIFKAYPHPCHINTRLKACHAGFNRASKALIWQNVDGQLDENDLIESVRMNSFCCHGCQHLGESGCTTRSLQCKLWFCGDHNDKWYRGERNVFDRLEYIRKISFALGFTGIREDREYNINLAMMRNLEKFNPDETKLLIDLTNEIVRKEKKL